MICQRVPPPTNAPPDAAATWNYHTAAITTSRRFLSVSTPSAPIQDSQPGIDAVPVTILREKPTQIRGSLPLITVEPTIDTALTQCASFADYASSLPSWEQGLLVHATGYSDATPLYDLLQQHGTKLLIASDGGHHAEYGSFGWVLATDREIIWECKGIARGNPMSSYRAEGYGRLSMLSFLTHYLHYFGIKNHTDLSITTYCDNESLLRKEEEFHTRDIDSSSLYTRPDHDVIMQLSALRTDLPFKIALLHVRGHQDDSCDFENLTRPAQLNVLADRLATEALNHPREAAEPIALHLTHFLPAEPISAT